ncbi:MAG: hypothetical protein DCC49_02355 [Acidobacteria bacterium]|nr:MAG: hypothetical protein DCC49_02355 [Acidobacteriota bacterium]
MIIGTGQVTNRPKSETRLRAPVTLMAEATELALSDAGVVAASIDSVQVVNTISWTYADPAGELAEAIGASPAESIYTTVGGNTPQWLVNRACEMISKGERELVLISGAESFASATAARSMGRKLDRGNRGEQPQAIGDDRPGAGPAEMQSGLIAPAQIYPLIENAYRASKGRSVAEHQAVLGSLCESFNRVAAENPLSWLPERHTAEEIVTPTPLNRMIGFPYTKWMNSIMKVDQGASLLIASAEKAEELGVERDKWVFPQAGTECNDPWFVSQRPDLAESPAIRAAGTASLEAAGVGIDDIEFIDLYSCFPCAVELGADALGLPADGSRQLTVTGGLMYFGGPGNNYATHSIATMVGLLRESPESYGLCTALGWYVTKHAVGVYSGTPPAEGFKRPDISARQAEIDSSELSLGQPESGETVEIVAYTVLYDREGKPMSAPAVVECKTGRAIVHLPDDSPTDEELVGRNARIHDVDGQVPKAELV